MSEIASLGLYTDPNIEAYYRMTSGALTTDESGNSKTLTETGDVTEEIGIYGGASGYTGTATNFLYISDNVNITTGDCSFSFWFYLDSLPTASYDYLLFRLNTGDTNDLGEALFYQYNGGTYRFNARHARWNVAYDQNYYTVTLNTGQWYNAVYIRNTTGTKIQLYLNGSLVIDGSYTTGNGTGTTTATLDIGRALDGRLDDFAAFSRVLTTGEIDDIVADPNYLILADVGAFTLTGISIAEKISISASTGAFNLTGNAAGLKDASWQNQNETQSTWTLQDKS